MASPALAFCGDLDRILSGMLCIATQDPLNIAGRLNAGVWDKTPIGQLFLVQTCQRVFIVLRVYWGVDGGLIYTSLQRVAVGKASCAVKTSRKELAERMLD